MSKWFTIAKLKNDKSSDFDALLFCDLKKTGWLLQQKNITKLMQTAEVQTALGTAVLWHTYDLDASDELILSNNLTTLIDATNDSLINTEIDVCINGAEYKTINLQECYQTCTRMEKLVVGCPDCLTNNLSSGCAFKHAYTSHPPNSLLHLRGVDTFINRKTSIGDFTYISPRLTREEPFQKNCRKFDAHDFTNIEHWSNIAKEANTTKARVNRFIKNTCSQCHVQPVCFAQYGNLKKDVKWCAGHYPKEEESLIQKLLETTKITYSDEELTRLVNVEARNIYKLPTGEFVMWDFVVEREELTFGFRRYTSPTRSVIPVQTLEEANAMLSKTTSPLRAKQYNAPAKMSHRAKALLCCTGRITHSPRMTGAWHVTEYPVMYKELKTVMQDEHTYVPVIELHFGHTYYNRNSKGRFLRWTHTVRNFKDVFEYYKKIHGVYQIPSEHGRKYP
jgi:hypothetical protein